MDAELNWARRDTVDQGQNTLEDKYVDDKHSVLHYESEFPN